MKHLVGKKAILYSRVSTTDQKDYGNSLTTQHNRLNEFCITQKISVVKNYEEDFSAKNFKRPVFGQLMEYATKNKKDIDLMLIYKWDRFSRNTSEALIMINQLKGYGIEVNCSDQWVNHDDPNQLVMLLLNLGIPEADNRIRRDRTIEGTRSNLKEGRWVNMQPKGYIKGKDEVGKVLMKPNPIIAPLITELFTDFSLGAYSQNELRELPKYKLLNLSRSGLSRILNQIAYSGKIIVPAYKDEAETIVDALHKPLVSKEIFNKVQIELGNRKRIKHKPSKKNDLLPLRGYLKCKECGGNLTGGGVTSGTGKKHYYYHCNRRKGCKETFKVALAHNAIIKLFNQIKPKEEVCNLFEHILQDKFDNSELTNKSVLKSTDISIKKTKNRKEMLLNKSLDGIIDDETFKAKDKELSNEIDRLKYERGQINNYEKDSMEFIRFGIHIIKNIGTFFEKATINTKQKLISSIFKEKLIFNGERYRTPIFNKGVELISQSISVLDSLKNKNERLSFDNLPLCTRDGT
jgi:site-specific DNA recombinase